MEMETLAYLARSDSSDSDVASSDGRPTPLDPEYWRGITHSLEETVTSKNAYRRANQMDLPHSSYHLDHHQHYTPASHSQFHQPLYVTSRSSMIHNHGVPNDGGFLLSPIHRQAEAPMISVSPVTQMNVTHAGGYMSPTGGAVTPDTTRFAERNNFQLQGNITPIAYPSLTPQELKLQVREAMVRAQAFLDLVPFFRSYDLSFTGGLRLGTIQEALGRMGVIVGDHVLQSISQLFDIPGSRLVDYVAFSQFLQLDAFELDNVRSIVAARRSVLKNSNIELGDIFAHYDSYRTGFVSRSTFTTLLQNYNILIPHTTLHLMMIQLANSSDTTSISYVRFLEMTDVGVARSAAVHLPHARPMNIPLHCFSGSAVGQAHLSGQESPTQGYNLHSAVPLATQSVGLVNHASASPDFATHLPRLGWVCRVCTHQQIADWATHCEICETSKPRPGLRGEGYIKCLHCEFDNNYDLDECEMCGRPLNANNKKVLKSEKMHRLKKRYIPRSSLSSSPSLSPSSSSTSSDCRQTRKRKTERHSRSSQTSRKNNKKKLRFQRGEEIQAIPRGGRVYELGVIVRVRSNRKYDIDFDNGLREKNVEEGGILEVSRARIIKTWNDSDNEESQENTSAEDFDHECSFNYDHGDRIEAQIQGQGNFFAGTITKRRIGEAYDITYDNGKVEHQVRSKFIRKIKCDTNSPLYKTTTIDSEMKSCKQSFEKFQPVEVQYNGKSKFYSGVISRCRLNGTYDIDYDDGEKETGVAAELIRPLNKKVGHDADDDMKQKKFKEGDKVEAQYKGKSKFYSGVISRCRLNGTYDIDYDDGEKETGVAAELISILGSLAGHTIENDPDNKIPIGLSTTFGNEAKSRSVNTVPSQISYRVGTRVEARYMGRDKYCKGTISRANGDETYVIEYDDGDRETRVANLLIRPLKSLSSFRNDDFASGKPIRSSQSGSFNRRSGNLSD